MAMTEQEMQMQIEIAKARAKAKQSQNANLDAEIKARQTPPSQPLPSHVEATQDYTPLGKAADVVLNPSGLTTGVAKGVANAALGTVQTAQAVGNSIGGYLGKKYDEYAPSVGLSPRDPAGVQAQQNEVSAQQKALEEARFQPQTKEDQIWMPVGQVGAGIAAAGGVGGAVKEALPAAVGTVGKYLGGTAAAGLAAAATNPEQEGMIVNSHGYVGFKIDPKDDPATQQSKKFVNQALDNMVLGVAGDGAFALGAKGVEVIKNIGNSIFKWNSIPAMQQQAAEDVLSVYAQLGEHPTAEQQQQAAQQVIDLINKNGVDTYDFGQGVGPKAVKKDTVSTLTSGLDNSNPFDRAVETRMEALRASAKRGQAPKTAVQLDEPSRVLNEGLQDAQTVRGGEEAINQTKQVLQDRAQTEAAQLDAPVQRAKDDIVQQSSDFTGTLKNDPTFGPAVRDAEQGGVPLDVNAKATDLKKTIVEKAGVAQETDKAVRDAAYKAVGATKAPAQMDEFKAVVDKYKDTIPENIQALIDKADGTYGYLYNEVRPRLSEAIGNAYKTKDAVSYDALMALKKNIDTDQIAWLTENGSEQTVQAARNAAKANAEYSKKWNDTIGQELRVNKNNNKWSPGTLQERGRDIVDSAISNPNRRESIDNLKTILGPDEGLVADTALAKATQDITAGKGANIEKVTSDLQTMANSFGPKEKARLEGFLTDLKSKKMSIDELQAKIPELEQRAAAEKEEIFGSRFPTLFEKVGGKQVPKGNGYDVFRQAMDSEQPRVIESLIKEASKNPADMAGIQTAWLKSAESKINASSKQVGKLDDQFVQYGKKIFGEDSPEVQSITALRDTAAKLEASLNRPGMEGLSATKNQSDFRTALSAVQTWMFGVLNPTAARVRTITSNLAEAYNSTSTSHQAIDNILSDNQAMKTAMEKLIYKSKTQMSPAMWKQLWESGAKLGLYSMRPTSGLNFQTDKAISK